MRAAGTRRAGRIRCRAVSLIELLIAVGITGAVLAASWGWLWSCAATARTADARAQSATAAAFAARLLRDDLEVASALAPPPAAYPPDWAVCVEHRHPGAAVETVLVVWDPGRRVLWRKASGSYLAEAVTAFSVEYFDAEGDRILPGGGNAGAWPGDVVRVRCHLVVGAEPRSAAATVEVVLEST